MTAAPCEGRAAVPSSVRDLGPLLDREVDPSDHLPVQVCGQRELGGGSSRRPDRILNHRGFAISPTVKEGYILRVADDLVRIMETTTGRLAVTFPMPLILLRVSSSTPFRSSMER